jgi:hypothetical protein
MCRMVTEFELTMIILAFGALFGLLILLGMEMEKIRHHKPPDKKLKSSDVLPAPDRWRPN